MEQTDDTTTSPETNTLSQKEEVKPLFCMDEIDREIEERERKREKFQAQRRAELACLYQDLNSTLKTATPQTPILSRQAEVLDKMLTALMRDNLKNDINNTHLNEDRLNMALRIQKQCMDTIKASAAIEYMQFIAAPNDYPPLLHDATPLPLHNGEQKEGPLN